MICVLCFGIGWIFDNVLCVLGGGLWFIYVVVSVLLFVVVEIVMIVIVVCFCLFVFVIVGVSGCFFHVCCRVQFDVCVAVYVF